MVAALIQLCREVIRLGAIALARVLRRRGTRELPPSPTPHRRQEVVCGICLRTCVRCTERVALTMASDSEEGIFQAPQDRDSLEVCVCACGAVHTTFGND